MKKKILFYTLTLCTSLSSYADFIVPVTDEPFVFESGVTFGENVIVPDGATLKFGGGTYAVFDFLEGTGIIVENGGRFLTQDVTIQALNDSWEGIEILPDPTNNLTEVQAVIMANSTIRDAIYGIYMVPSGFKPRNVYVNDCDFINNRSHIGGGTTTAGALINNSATYGTVFKNSNFLKPNGETNWPILLWNASNYLFDNCVFDYDDTHSDVGLHFDRPNNVHFNECTFKQTGNIGVTCHFDAVNIRFTGNHFDNGPAGANNPLAEWQTEYKYVGVLMGGLEGTHIEDFVFHDNSFTSMQSHLKSAGLYIAVSLSVVGFAENVDVFHNSFRNYGTGVHAKTCTFGDNSISNNGFFDCYRGIIAGENNASLYITCNSFFGGHTAIKILDNANLPSHSTFNSNNGFFNPYYGIVNDEGIFNYAVPSNTYPNIDDLNSGINVIVNPGLKVKCKRSPWKKPKSLVEDEEVNKNENTRSNGTATIYPNPSSSIVNILLNGFEGKPVNITIYDVTGKVMDQITDVQNVSETISVSDYVPGMYLIDISSETQTIHEKLIVE